jgi:hypothetical protein
MLQPQVVHGNLLELSIDNGNQFLERVGIAE